MEPLKACPFCGGDESEDNATQSRALYLTSFPSPAGMIAHRVECNCGVRGASDLQPQFAAQKWNRRTMLTPSPRKEMPRRNTHLCTGR